MNLSRFQVEELARLVEEKDATGIQLTQTKGTALLQAKIIGFQGQCKSPPIDEVAIPSYGPEWD